MIFLYYYKYKSSFSSVLLKDKIIFVRRNSPAAHIYKTSRFSKYIKEIKEFRKIDKVFLRIDRSLKGYL